AKARNSFCEEEGTGAGEAGADGVSCFTQHARVAQCLSSHPVRQQLCLPLPEAAPLVANRLTTPWPATINPSSRTNEASVSRRAMTLFAAGPSRRSSRNLPESRARGNVFSNLQPKPWSHRPFPACQFLSTPQVSMDLPI